MTSPDMNFPAGAYGRNTASSMQNVTQQSIADVKNAEVKNILAQVRTTFIGNILGGFLDVVGAIGAAINKFISDLLIGLRNVTGGMIDLTGWLKQTQVTAETALSETVNTGQVIQQVRTDVATISAPIAESWETMVPGQQVSFPRVLLNASWKESYDSGNNSNPGGAFENVISIYDSQDANVFIRYTRIPRYTPPANTIESVCILSNYAVGRAVVNYAVEAVSGSPCQLYIYISRMLPNGNVVVEWVSENQTPTISNARAEREVVVPDPREIGFALGEYMVVSIHQCGSGTVRPLLGIEMTSISRPGVYFPPQQKFQFVRSTPLTEGSLIAMADQNYGSNYIPWIGIGQRIFTGDPLPRHYFDDFQRGSVGDKWTSVGDKPMYIYDGELSYLRQFLPADGYARIMYAQPLAYDDQRVTGTVAGNGVGNLTVEPMKLIYRGNANGKTFCSLDIRRDSVTLARMTNNSPAVMNVVNITTNVNDKWKIEVVGNLHKGYRKAVGTADWVFVIEWIDNSGVGGTPVVPSGPEYRYTGMSVQRYSGSSSGGWKDYDAQDLVEVTP